VERRQLRDVLWWVQQTVEWDSSGVVATGLHGLLASTSVMHLSCLRQRASIALAAKCTNVHVYSGFLPFGRSR
jgi:hypothetical protein